MRTREKREAIQERSIIGIDIVVIQRRVVAKEQHQFSSDNVIGQLSPVQKRSRLRGIYWLNVRRDNTRDGGRERWVSAVRIDDGLFDNTAKLSDVVGWRRLIESILEIRRDKYRVHCRDPKPINLRQDVLADAAPM